MRVGPERAGAWTAAVLTALCTAAAGALALAHRPPSEVAMALAGAFIPYALLLREGSRIDGPFETRALFALAALTGLVLVLAPPVLSDDLYRYLWDARVASHGIDPYRYAPADPALAFLRDALFARVNHRSIPTIYPPLAQLLFLLANAVAHAAWSMKALALLAHLGTAWVVGRLGRGRVAGAGALYALHPLALGESALCGHIDAVAALCVAAFVLALVRARPFVAACIAGLASGIKLLGVALAPLLLGRRNAPAVALAAGLALLPVVPLITAGWGSGATSGLGHYARRWEGNAGAFVLLSAASRATLSAVGAATGAPPGHVRLTALRPLLQRVEGTPFDPRAAVMVEKKGHGDLVDFEASYAGALLARLLAAAAVLGLAVTLGLRRIEPVLAARWVLLTLLVLSPEVHPWYLLWLLPIELASGKRAGLVWSAAVLVAYAPLDAWTSSRIWAESGTARLLEYLLLAVAVVVEEWKADRAVPPPSTIPSVYG